MDRTRDQIQSDLDLLHDYHEKHSDRDSTARLSSQKLLLEVLLDIRDILRRMEKGMGVEKWGSKL